jgi:hypothetical protein
MSNDLDQGGVAREWVDSYFGPSLGWFRTQVNNANFATVTSGGTTAIGQGIAIVGVNVAALVTIQLPTVIVTPGAFQLSFVSPSVIIADIGGNAAAFPITILPYTAGGETIMGLSSIQIQNNFGSFTLLPTQVPKGWVQQ